MIISVVILNLVSAWLNGYAVWLYAKYNKVGRYWLIPLNILSVVANTIIILNAIIFGEIH